MYTAALDKVPARADEDGHVHVFIETPAGSQHKVDLNHEFGLLEWSLELPLGGVFPYAFGFIPKTLAEDGDALDVLLLSDPGIPPGALVIARLIGVLRTRQDEDGSGKADTPNVRVLAVPILSNSYSDVHDLDDLREGFVEEIDGFFRRYNEMIGRAFATDAPGDRRAAAEVLAAAEAAFRDGGEG